MERIVTDQRAGWRGIVESQGLVHHSHDPVLGRDRTYWNEGAYYRFTMEEIDRVEEATAEIGRLCLEAVDHVVRHRRFAEFKIPPAYWDYIAATWKRGDPALYGRMDFAYVGEGSPKLLEFNADTPTTAVETGVAQWLWMEDLVAAGRLPEGTDQFNSLHEKVIDRFRAMSASGLPPDASLFFAAMPVDEDVMTVEYLRDLAGQAGLDTAYIQLDHISATAEGRLVTPDGVAIDALYKLYPWEWVFTDSYGPCAARDETRFIEPAWRCLLSNKTILRVLWELFPGHENLLPTASSPLPERARQVKKPILGREGANVSISGLEGGPVVHDGDYGAEGYVWQAYSPLWQQGGIHAMLGSWLVGDEPAGMCVREADGPIIDNISRLVPHVIIG